jgi:uncharacterized protein with PIN domain
MLPPDRMLTDWRRFPMQSTGSRHSVPATARPFHDDMLLSMACARFRFYEELNDFLPAARRKTEFSHRFTRRASVKDMIESFGVPHTEVEIILVDGHSVGFSHIVRDGDRISVYPMFETLDVSSLLRVREAPLRKPRFVVDSNLGGLARYLRLLGMDALYQNDFSDDDVAKISQAQHRIVLTRDRRLLHRKIIVHGYFVRAVRPRDQTREVLARLDLYDSVQPFSRCIHCNGLLQAVDKSSVEHRLEPRTRQFYNRFLRCPDCQRVYWEGSHHERAARLVAELTTRARADEC